MRACPRIDVNESKRSSSVQPNTSSSSAVDDVAATLATTSATASSPSPSPPSTPPPLLIEESPSPTLPPLSPVKNGESGDSFSSSPKSSKAKTRASAAADSVAAASVAAASDASANPEATSSSTAVSVSGAEEDDTSVILIHDDDYEEEELISNDDDVIELDNLKPKIRPSRTPEPRAKKTPVSTPAKSGPRPFRVKNHYAVENGSSPNKVPIENCSSPNKVDVKSGSSPNESPPRSLLPLSSSTPPFSAKIDLDKLSSSASSCSGRSSIDGLSPVKAIGESGSNTVDGLESYKDVGASESDAAALTTGCNRVWSGAADDGARKVNASSVGAGGLSPIPLKPGHGPSGGNGSGGCPPLFTSGMEVVVRKDDAFLNGKIKKVDEYHKRCRVSFPGQSDDVWASFKEIQPGPSASTWSNADARSCSVCAQECSKETDDDLVTCFRCDTSFHQRCHAPVVSSQVLNSSPNWKCQKCRSSLAGSSLSSLAQAPTPLTPGTLKPPPLKPFSGAENCDAGNQQSGGPAPGCLPHFPPGTTVVSFPMPEDDCSGGDVVEIEDPGEMPSLHLNPHFTGMTAPDLPLKKQPIYSCGKEREPKNTLSYNLSVLKWDARHQENEQKMYCYCGKFGDWYDKMLQCWRCGQWFHEGCVQVLQYPLLYGDRFYVFSCSVCNHGLEYVRRLDLNWCTIVHLVLFNLSQSRMRKYYDLDSEIMPFLNEHWDCLQLNQLSDTRIRERYDRVKSELYLHKDVFACGREIKKRTTLWGLRTRVPPYVPPFWIPANEKRIDDETLRQLALRGDDFEHLEKSVVDKDINAAIDATASGSSASSSSAVPSFHVASFDAASLTHVVELSDEEEESEEEVASNLVGNHNMQIMQKRRRFNSKRKRAMGCQAVGKGVLAQFFCPKRRRRIMKKDKANVFGTGQVSICNLTVATPMMKHQKKVKKEKGNGGFFIRLGQAIGAAGMGAAGMSGVNPNDGVAQDCADGQKGIAGDLNSDSAASASHSDGGHVLSVGGVGSQVLQGGTVGGNVSAGQNLKTFAFANGQTVATSIAGVQQQMSQQRQMSHPQQLPSHRPANQSSVFVPALPAYHGCSTTSAYPGGPATAYAGGGAAAAYHGGTASHVLVSPMAASGNSQQNPNSLTPQSFLIPVSALQQFNSSQSMQQQQSRSFSVSSSNVVGSHQSMQQPQQPHHHQQQQQLMDPVTKEEHNVKPFVATLPSSTSISSTSSTTVTYNTNGQQLPYSPSATLPPQVTPKSFFIMSPSGQIFAVTGQLPAQPHLNPSHNNNHPPAPLPQSTVNNVATHPYSPSPPSAYPHPPPLSPQCIFPPASSASSTYPAFGSVDGVGDFATDTKPLSSPLVNANPPTPHPPPLSGLHNSYDLPPPDLTRLNETSSSVNTKFLGGGGAHRIRGVQQQQQQQLHQHQSMSTPLTPPSNTPSRENSASRLASTSASSNITPCDTPIHSGSSSERESPFAEMGPLIPVPVKVKKSKHKKQKSKKKKEKYRLHSGHLEVVWKKQRQSHEGSAGASTKSRKRRHVDAFDARILDNSALASTSYAVGPSAATERFAAVSKEAEYVSKSEISPGVEDEVLLNNDSASDVIQLNDEEENSRETPLPPLPSLDVDSQLQQQTARQQQQRRTAIPAPLPPPPLFHRRPPHPNIFANWMKGVDDDDEDAKIDSTATVGATTRMSRRSTAASAAASASMSAAATASSAETSRCPSSEPPYNSHAPPFPSDLSRLSNGPGASSSSLFPSTKSSSTRLARMFDNNPSSLRLFTGGALEPESLKASVAGILLDEEQLANVTKGRKYRVCGKRKTPRGKIQYLVQLEEDG